MSEVIVMGSLGTSFTYIGILYHNYLRIGSRYVHRSGNMGAVFKQFKV